MSRPEVTAWLLAAILIASPALAQSEADPKSTADRPTHEESAERHDEAPPPAPEEAPSLPEGMTLDDVLDYAGSPPPEYFPAPVPDDRLYHFTFVEQLEYRVATDDTPDHLGWEAQGWYGGDFNKFWWKSEGEAAFEGSDEGETETDLLYSRLITPFWSVQAGAQYAYGWSPGPDEDRWSAVIALQGLAPYKFELDNSLYVSEDGDMTLAFEAEYDLRITQRLVLQPRTEIGISFQDIPERELGAGFTDATLDLRLRYEIRRELAPYIGLRYASLVGETEEIAEDAGADTQQFLLVGGLRFAF